MSWAKAQGKPLGRPTALSPDQQQIVREKIESGETVSAIARQFNTSRQAIMRVIPWDFSFLTPIYVSLNATGKSISLFAMAVRVYWIDKIADWHRYLVANSVLVSVQMPEACLPPRHHTGWLGYRAYARGLLFTALINVNNLKASFINQISG